SATTGGRRGRRRCRSAALGWSGRPGLAGMAVWAPGPFGFRGPFAVRLRPAAGAVRRGGALAVLVMLVVLCLLRARGGGFAGGRGRAGGAVGRGGALAVLVMLGVLCLLGARGGGLAAGRGGWRVAVGQGPGGPARPGAGAGDPSTEPVWPRPPEPSGSGLLALPEPPGGPRTVLVDSGRTPCCRASRAAGGQGLHETRAPKGRIGLAPAPPGPLGMGPIAGA